MNKLVAIIGGSIVAATAAVCTIGAIRRKNAAKLAAKVTKRTTKRATNGKTGTKRTPKATTEQVIQPDNSLA